MLGKGKDLFSDGQGGANERAKRKQKCLGVRIVLRICKKPVRKDVGHVLSNSQE